MFNQVINSSIITITTIPSRFSKQNWLGLHLKYCSFLTNWGLNGANWAFSVAGLSRNQNVWIGNFPFNTLNCGIGGDKVQNVLWRARNLPVVKSVKNVRILYGTNNLHLDAPEDVTDSIIKTGLSFKRLYTNVNAFICSILSGDCYWSINRVCMVKDVHEIFK